VWAVGRVSNNIGDRGIVIIHGRGRRWTVQHLRYKGNGVQALYVRSPRDIWIGANLENEYPLVLHYDGRRWTKMPRLLRTEGGYERGYVADVIALARNDAWAVGYTSVSHPPEALLYHWDGRRWTRLEAPPGVASLAALSRFSRRGFLALGSASMPPKKVVLRWDGAKFRIFAGKFWGSLYPGAMGAASSHELWATAVTAPPSGDGRAVVVHWNGRAFRVVRRLGRERSLFSVGVFGKHVWTVGYLYSNTGRASGIIDQWDGRTWRRAAFNGVAFGQADALSPRDVWALRGPVTPGSTIYHYACR